MSSWAERPLCYLPWCYLIQPQSRTPFSRDRKSDRGAVNSGAGLIGKPPRLGRGQSEFESPAPDQNRGVAYWPGTWFGTKIKSVRFGSPRPQYDQDCVRVCFLQLPDSSDALRANGC